MRAHNLPWVAAAIVATACVLFPWVSTAAANPLSGGWSAPVRIDANPNASGNDDPLWAMSCAPSGFLCVGGDANGDIVTSTSENDWLVPVNVDQSFYPRIDGVSCPSVSFCAAADDDGNVMTSTDPTGGTSKWTPPADIDANFPLAGIACPSSGFCVAIDVYGQVLTSTNPAGGAGAWSAPADVDGTTRLQSVSCAGTGLCVIGDSAGHLLASTDPGGGATKWSAPFAPVTGEGAITGISCPTTAFCAAATDDGRILTSTTPAGGAGAWSQAVQVMSINTVPPGGARLTSISCPASNFCAAVDGQGYVATSSSPTTSSWTHTNQIDTNQGPSGEPLLTSISCESSALCAAGDSAGSALTSESPASGTPWFVRAAAVVIPLESVSCPASNFCATSDYEGYVLTSSNPTGGASAWSAPDEVDDLSTDNTLTAISCATTSFCAAVDFDGNAFTSTTPTGSWSSGDAIDANGSLSGVSCPAGQTSLCVAVGSYVSPSFSGMERSSARPTRPPTRGHRCWTSTSGASV